MTNLEEMQRRLVFQSRLELLVENVDLEKTQLVEKIGVSYSTFSRALNHGVIPKIKILISIADYFFVSLDYLLNRKEDASFYPALKPTSFYERLTELRISKKIKTDYELAKELLIPKQYVYYWANSNQLPTLENLEDIANHFDVSLDYLVGRTDLKK